MELDVTTMVNTIVQSTTDYLVIFAPLFLLIAGIVLAFVIVDNLIEIFFNRQKNESEVE